MLLDSLQDIKMPDERRKVVIKNILAQVDMIQLSQKRKQSKKKKLIWRCTVSFAVVAIFILGIKNLYPLLCGGQNDASIAKNTPEYTDSSNNVSPNMITTRERIVKKKEYGVVNLSKRSSSEISTLIHLGGVTFDKSQEVKCYEDEKNIYFFYEDGTVAGVMAAYLNDPTYAPDALWSVKSLSEEEAVVLAKKALLKYYEYYTSETAERFISETWHDDEDDAQHYPEWRITFREYTESGICRNTVEVDIDIYGNIAEVFFGIRSNVSDKELLDNKYITEENAISCALAQFAREKLDVDLEHFQVRTNLKERKGSVVWEIYFEEVEKNGYKQEYQQFYWMTLEAVSGNWISTDIGR